MKSQPEILSINDFSPRQVLGDISVVIPTLGRPILEQSLYWIASGSSWPGELIIVDQGSSSQAASWVINLNAMGITSRYIPSNQIGRAAGVNRGLECVKTRFVAITDDDCFVDPEWLANMVDYLRKSPQSIVTGCVKSAGNQIVFSNNSSLPKVHSHPRLKAAPMSGGNSGTSLEVIRHVGLLDEDPRLRYAEDTEWSYRALCKGIPIVYVPEVVVEHYGWRERAEMADQFYGYACSHGGFYGKYIRKGDLLILARAVIHQFRALRWWVSGKINGNADLALIGKAYFTGLLPGIMAGLRAR